MKSIRGTFTRVSPTFFADKIGLPQGWFVISHNWIPTKKDRRLNHGKWYKIQSSHGSVYRILRFSVRLKGTPNTGKGDIVLDWPALLKLSGYAEETDEQLELSMEKVSWWQVPFMVFSHPDPTHKLAGELGLLSAALGLLSIAITLCA